MSLSINNLSVFLPTGQTIVDNISLTVNRGEIVALVGASGSGKSVAVTATLGLLTRGLRMTGNIFLDNKPIDYTHARGKRIACIIQNPASAFNPVYTMKQHAIETLKAVGLPHDINSIYDAMKDAGLEDLERVLHLYSFQMSGGMLQRMMLALALMSKADYLIADEPTTDLDLIVQSHILQRLKHIAHDRKLGILLVTHDLGVVAKLADRVAVMSQGKLVDECNVMQLFDQPQSEAAKKLLNAHYAMYATDINSQSAKASVTLDNESKETTKELFSA